MSEAYQVASPTDTDALPDSQEIAGLLSRRSRGGQPRPTSTEYEAAFSRFWEQSGRRRYAVKTTEAPHYRRYVLQHRKHAPDSDERHSAQCWVRSVNDGNGVMFISHAGLNHPSGFLPVVCGVFPLDHMVRVCQPGVANRLGADRIALQNEHLPAQRPRPQVGSPARGSGLAADHAARQPPMAPLRANHPQQLRVASHNGQTHEGIRTRKTDIASGDYVEYAWDHRNRLTTVTFRNSSDVKTKEVTNTYDVFDRRLAKDVDDNGTIDRAKLFNCRPAVPTVRPPESFDWQDFT